MADDISIQSKRFKSAANKRYKAERLQSNHRHRAGLHAQKAACGNSNAADLIQQKIDKLSKGVHA